MARLKTAQPTLEALLFQTPEQKVLRLLLTESTTAFTHRVIASKLKGVRGLGGVEGITKILEKLESLGFVDFLDHRRSVRLHDDSSIAQILKTVSAVCDLETLKGLLAEVSTRGVMIGSRATGKSRSDSDYDIVVVTDQPAEVTRITERHPLGKNIIATTMTHDEFLHLDQKDEKLAGKVKRGITLWGHV